MTDSDFLLIAGLISNDDEGVKRQLNECLCAPYNYALEHEDEFEERGLSVDDAEEQREEFCFLAMVDILEEHNDICERDYKDELEDFLYFIGELNIVKKNGLPMNDNWFDEEDDITIWCKILDEKWSGYGMTMAAIDIDSDSYVLFASNKSIIAQLSCIASRNGRRIGIVE